jgi:hypothetical protein
MLKTIFVFVFTITFSQITLACDDSQLLKKIIEMETSQLLKNAPTFKHAFEDKKIKLQISEAALDQKTCRAKLTVTLPKLDLDEANQHLNEQPSKKILLSAQGYAIPDRENNEVLYFYENNPGFKPLNENNVELRSLYSNIEYTYQLLAQIRINVDEKSPNSISWPTDQTQQEIQYCLKTHHLSEEQCQCRIKKISAVISPRKMELVQFIQNQPYSVATGAMNSYMQFSQSVNESCTK